MQTRHDPAIAPPIERLRQCFDALIALTPSEREAWLAVNVFDAGERAAVRRLLDASEQSSFLDTPMDAQIERLAAVEIQPEGLIGQQVGEFRLVKALGRGGMAAVFLGERVGRDFAQRGAVKLLQRGLYSELEQRLFQRERQVLAALDHPNIARLIDGGITPAGIPYLVMEFVDGVSIADYARLHDLDVRQRLKLFLDACRAVEAAHRSLIVHRDIKPANILVTAAGEVKLLDFGIAKLIADDADNATGTLGIFTPEYAAPEQVRGGAVTTATDVYALGVLLHELLTGQRPSGTGVRRPSSQLRAVAAAQQPAAPAQKYTPAQLRRLLRGDLDNVLLKALETEPAMRYVSAGALADDIERHLDGRPVHAHPATRRYRMRKFVARHRAGVAVASLVLLALLSMLALALWQARVAREATAFAQSERERAEQVRDYLLSIFREQDPLSRAQARVRAPQQLIADAVKRLDESVTDAPRVHADLLGNLGEIQYNLGDIAAASATLERAVVERRAAMGVNSIEVAQSLATLCQLRNFAPTADDARDACADALAIYRANGREESVDAALVKLYFANELRRRRNAPPEAFDLLAQAQKTLEAQLGPNDQRTVAALISRAELMDAADMEGPKSEALLREAIARLTAGYGEDNVWLWRPWVELGMTLRDEYRYPEAEQAYLRGIALLRRHFGEKYPYLAQYLGWLAAMYTDMGRRSEAEATFAAALAALPPGDSYERAFVLRQRSSLELPTNPEQAERDTHEAYELYVKLFGEHAIPTAAAAKYWADALKELGRLREAEALERKALGEHEALLGGDSAKLGMQMESLADTIERSGDRPQEVVALLRRALALIGSKYPHDNAFWADAAIGLADALLTLGAPADIDEARGLIDEAFKAYPGKVRQSGNEGQLCTPLAVRGRLYALTGKTELARADLREALRLYRPVPGNKLPDSPSIARTRQLLRQLDATMSEPEPAHAARG
ncbi:MAG: serine/threonine-protein kinase [Rudaea sp.]|uniref:serine/threonine protein kinase n=1 Tax=Rudaea sp. TaxID=2136325 RepID=UPI0039E27489